MFLNCVHWIGEANHFDALEAILDSGFDPTSINSLHVTEWPAPSNPNWLSEEHVHDAFYVEYLAIICKNNQGELTHRYLEYFLRRSRLCWNDTSP